MKRKIIQIDEEKCNGCGACAAACHEGAIGMEDGKAKLLRDDYCDGLGDCLPTCPTGAITFVEREAAAYDEAAVQRHKQAKVGQQDGCPGTRARRLAQSGAAPGPVEEVPSELQQWPVQLKLVPVNAPCFDGADILIAADCTAYTYAGFHQRFIRGHVTLIGCPKLDEGDYAEKLSEIFRGNDVKSIHVVRMEVPCCGGLLRAVQTAVQQSGKEIPVEVTVLSVEGKILER